MPLCLPDDGDAVDQDESGITNDRSLPLVLIFLTMPRRSFQAALYRQQGGAEFPGFAYLSVVSDFFAGVFREYEMKYKAKQYNELIRCR